MFRMYGTDITVIYDCNLLQEYSWRYRTGTVHSTVVCYYLIHFYGQLGFDLKKKKAFHKYLLE